jgi:hypothetical protein
MRKIYLSLIISFFISSTSFALPGNRFFPSQEAKDHCTSIAWTDNSSPPISIIKRQDNRTDGMRKMEYDKCIRDWYKD